MNSKTRKVCDMNKIMAVIVLAATSVVAGEDMSFRDPTQMALRADKAVGAIQTPVPAKIVDPTGIQVAPSLSGGVVTADVWTFKDSVAKVGFFKTMAQVPVQFPKTVTAAAILVVVTPIIANNPKLLGLSDKDESSASASTATASPTVNNGIVVNANGNYGSQITIVVKPSQKVKG